MNSSKYQLVTVLGPTAAGKTKLASHLAAQINGEIISADSRQVYKQMTLGTGKDYDDYIVEGKPIPYHLIDILEPGYKYNVFEFQSDFFKAFNNVVSRQKFPIMCGGSGLYLEAVLNNYKLIAVPINDELRLQLNGQSLETLSHIISSFKTLHNTTDIDSIPRAIRAIEIETYYRDHHDVKSEFPNINSLIVGVDIDRNARRSKITKRLKERLKQGMVDEVKHLLDQGVSADDLVYYGLEYKYVTLFLVGKLSYDEMFVQLETAIHQFSKRQMTWFRRMERNGFNIHWVDAFEPIEDRVNRIVEWMH